jgi:hypothetical protein
VTPSPTYFSSFSGIRALPVQSQRKITKSAMMPLNSIGHHILNVGKMNIPPVKMAAINAMKLGP